MNKEAVQRELEKLPRAQRFPLALAYADPAFEHCLLKAVASVECVENFDRLAGCRLSQIGTRDALTRMIDAATGFEGDSIKAFATFVHDGMYLRLPDVAIHAFRLASIAAAP
jgi:hypothetical protein